MILWISCLTFFVAWTDFQSPAVLIFWLAECYRFWNATLWSVWNSNRDQIYTHWPHTHTHRCSTHRCRWSSLNWNAMRASCWMYILSEQKSYISMRLNGEKSNFYISGHDSICWVSLSPLCLFQWLSFINNVCECSWLEKLEHKPHILGSRSHLQTISDQMVFN